MKLKTLVLTLLSLSVLTSCGEFKLTATTIPAKSVDTQTTKDTQPTKDTQVEKKEKVEVVQVQVNPDKLVVPVGQSKSLQATVIYKDDTKNSAVTWSSSDDSIVSINSSNGKISALKEGVVTVIATAMDDPSKKAIVQITVKPAEVVEALAVIEPQEASIKVGDTITLNAKIKLSDGSESPNVVWTSSNQSVAIVTNGLVTGVGEGDATITAQAAGDPTKKASAKIKVEKKQ